MGISSLRLKGFKSFGNSCEFEFSRKFTAIVGPNGSGKSNILDALKWILGEGSSSELRISKQSDLLFQGSKSTPAAEAAEVILKLISENDKCTLRRLYSRDAGSLIFIDGKKIPLQYLNTLKSRFSLGGEGFALIGQGEISETIHQKPKERRRQLDSLFKMENYREKRDKTAVQLQETQNDAQRIQTLLHELTSRREEISPEVIKAAQANEIITSLEELRSAYYRMRREQTESKISGLAELLISQKETLRQLNFWCSLWTRLGEEYKLQAENENEASYSSQLEKIIIEKDSLHRKAFQDSMNLRTAISKLQALHSEMPALTERREALGQERTQKHSEYQKIFQEAESKQKELEEKRNEFSKAQGENPETESHLNPADNIAEIKLGQSVREAELRALENAEESRQHELNELEQSEISKRDTVSTLENQKSLLEEKFSRLNSSYEHETSEVQKLRAELAHLENQYETLENSAIFTVSYPDAVRELMKAADENIIRSQPKPVADVFSCSSSEAANAVEAFLGARQYWMLVHSMEDAYEGIEYIKSKMLGRVTYLSDENIRPRKYDPRMKISGRIMGWAVNLVSVQSEWKDAIYYLIGDLLIVEDYVTAVKIMRQGAKFPIATIEGEIISPSGSVSGGLSRNMSGAVTALHKKDEISVQAEKLRKSVLDMKIQLEEHTVLMKQFRRDAEDTAGTLERIKYDLNYEKRNLNTITQNLNHARNEHEQSEIRMAALRNELNTAEQKIKELENELKTQSVYDADTEKTDRNTRNLEDEISVLLERMNLVRKLYEHTESEYESVCSEIERAEKEIAELTKTVSECRWKLREIAGYKKNIYLREKQLRAEILKSKEANSKALVKLEHIRRKIELSNARVSEQKHIISQSENKKSVIENELAQLIELWEDKYPYDADSKTEKTDVQKITASVKRLERELKILEPYNLAALSEDESLRERIKFLTSQLEDVNTSVRELEELISDTDAKVEEEFESALSKIDARFNALFQRLFGGGEAKLKLQDGDVIWEKGIEIFARPPGKKLQNISQLSGGEQSLTSIALIFATLEAAGTPLAVLDEVDAALDEYNLIRFADLAKEYSETIQIIAMTHRRATMERADLIYGVTMIEPGLTSTIGVDPKKYA